MTKTAQMTNDQLDEGVLFFLRQHIGEESKIDRWELVEKVFHCIIPAHLRNDDHPQDRLVRDSVKRLRNQGYLICDMGDGGGRWMAKNWDEFIKFYGRFIKPISSQANTARAMLKAARHQFPNSLQPSLFDAPQSDAPDFDDVLVDEPAVM